MSHARAPTSGAGLGSVKAFESSSIFSSMKSALDEVVFGATNQAEAQIEVVTRIKEALRRDPFRLQHNRSF